MRIRIIPSAFSLGLAFALAQWWHIVALWDVPVRSHWGIIWFLLMSLGTCLYLWRGIRYELTGQEKIEVTFQEHPPRDPL